MARYKEYGYDIQDGKAIIPEWETEIKDKAFEYSKELTSVELPQWIKKIGENAFYGCENLTEITLPEWVEEIGESAFCGCKNIKSIDLPRWVKKIEDSAFCGCSSLTSIIIPPSITEIGVEVFWGCKSLTSITIPPSVTKIGGSAFNGCSGLTSITVSKDNKVYDSREDCNAIIHTESNTLIRGCENTVIPPSVTEIGKSAFSRCSCLTSISIPPSVTVIGKDAFFYCSSLTSITVSKDNKVYDSREDCNAIIRTESNTLISGCKSTIIPPSVTEIGEWAFSDCSSLTSITIPPSVTEIGRWAFSRCSSLTSISVSKDNKVYDSREDCNAIIRTESNTLISGCKSTIIPPSVTKIGSSAFHGCSSLTNISIPPIGDGDWKMGFLSLLQPHRSAHSLWLQCA